MNVFNSFLFLYVCLCFGLCFNDVFLVLDFLLLGDYGYEAQIDIFKDFVSFSY